MRAAALGAAIMRIAGVASAFPKHYYKQEVLVAALKDYWQGKLVQPGILDRLDESMKVDGRFTARIRCKRGARQTTSGSK
jgi:hypothetical protein